MAKYDVVVVGGGHNGLIAAAYLAKAGLDVCIIERQDKVGGGVITRELTLPGFKDEPGSIVHGFIQLNPLLANDELKLKSKYGLNYIHDEGVQVASLLPDDRALFLWKDVDKTCESIEQFSRKDAEAYHRLQEIATGAAQMMTAGMFEPPVPFGEMMSLLDGMGEDGQEILRIMLASAIDVCNEWFESEEVKVALSRFATELCFMPQEQGTGANMVFFIGLGHLGVFAYGRGGSGALADALERCLKDLGATIRTSTSVKRIKVEGGEAKGVVLDTGEEVSARKAVISNLNVKQLFLQMLEAEELPDNFQAKVRRIKPSAYSAIHQALALNEAPKYKAGGELNRSTFIQFNLMPMDDYLRLFEDFSHGVPRTDMPLVVCATLIDPTRAPEGKHTLYLLHFAPYRLKEGPAKWDEIKQEVADGVLRTLQAHTTNMGRENILGRWICSPLDFERYNPAWVEGDFFHIGAYMTQNMAYRPIPGWGNYRTPIGKLYMCGASTYPGGAVSGGSRAAVQVIMQDLGVDFTQVIQQ